MTRAADPDILAASAMHRIKNPNQVFTGIFLILVSLLAFYLSWPLSSRTDVGLGPGFVPKLFAFVQLGLGALMIVNGFVQPGEPVEAWHLRPVVLVLAAVAFFAMAIERMGLVVALTGLVLISCAAHRGTTLREALSLAVGSVVVSVLLFVKALGLTMALWPSIPWGN
jgi:putative tricarboxylic transport membrane protein